MDGVYPSKLIGHQTDSDPIRIQWKNNILTKLVKASNEAHRSKSSFAIRNLIDTIQQISDLP